MTVPDLRGGRTEMAYVEPYCFAQLRADFIVARTDFLPPAPVLLHGLDAGGGERLVVVSVQRAARDQRLHGAMPAFGNTLLLGWAARPATWTADPPATSSSWDCPDLATPPEVGHLRLYAGQRDPNDASHFTIACDTAAGRRVIDGWLQPDDTLKFALRPLPTSSPAPVQSVP